LSRNTQIACSTPVVDGGNSRPENVSLIHMDECLSDAENVTLLHSGDDDRTKSILSLSKSGLWTHGVIFVLIGNWRCGDDCKLIVLDKVPLSGEVV
jgi:hypothetical protein